jgi:hypothetical protein
MLACVSVPPVPWGGSSLLHARVVYHPQAALRLERLAREEAEQTLQAEREVMLAVQQMQQQQTVQRARAHVDAQRETAEAMTEAEAAARLLTRSGAHLSESAAAAAAAGTCLCRVTPSRLVLAASFVCAMVMARRPACSAVRACQELERERERARPMPYAPWLTGYPLPLSATAGAANRAVMERGSDTWRKLGQEILSLETNIDYIESMLLPDGEEQQGEEEEQQEQEQGSRGM